MNIDRIERHDVELGVRYLQVAADLRARPVSAVGQDGDAEMFVFDLHTAVDLAGRSVTGA